MNTDHKFCLLFSIPVKIWSLKHLAMFFVTCRDAGLNKHKNWYPKKSTEAPQARKKKFSELNREMLWAAQLQAELSGTYGHISWIEAPVCADGAPSQSNAYLLHLHLVLAFKAVCNKRAEPPLLFVLSHISISCCICLTWTCNRGYDTCNWGGLGDNEDSPHLLSCSKHPVMCVSVLRFYHLLGLIRDQNQNQAKGSYRK